MFIEVSSNLKKLAKLFPENLYIVGGYVRNKILEIPSGDVDLASNLDIEEVSNRLKDTDFSVKVKNLRLGSLLITIDEERYEYTSFRKDVYPKNGSHTPISVVRTDKIEDDAIRRDFTVNSIYYNINKDEVVDIYHGIIDLKQKIIRCNVNPDEVLNNDGERVLRMVRFAGELDFRIDKLTLTSALKFVNNIKDISGERRFAEIEKILYCDKRYNNKGGLKRALGLLNVMGVWKSLGLKFKRLKCREVFKVEDRVMGLLIDIVDNEKPQCLQTFLETFLKEQFAFSNANIRKSFMLLSGYYNALAGMRNKEYFFKYYKDWTSIKPLIKAKSKRIKNKYNFFYKYINEHGLIISLDALAINENDIKKTFKKIDSRNYNRILTNLWSKVFDCKIKNEKDELLKEIEKNLQNY